MAGATVQITLDDADVQRALGALLMRTASLQPAFEEFGNYEVSATQHRIEHEVTPEGARWPELAPITVRKRVSKRGPMRGPDHMLRVKNFLFSSLTYIASALDLAVGSNRIYAALQQLGGTDDMKGGAAHVPPRPYLGLSRDDEQELGAVLVNHLGGAFA